MPPKFNIVIPSIQLSEELIYCLLKLNNQTYKNFFVTIVLDFENKIKLPILKYKLNKLISGKKNMSLKRNLGVKKFESKIVAFLDSDAYPQKDWLKSANKFLTKKSNIKTICGGPSIPFPNQSYNEMLCHYAKRSFYVTGYLNFRKFRSKDRYCDWIESCNMFMQRALYLKHGGMNIKKYLGEDKELIARMKKNDKSIKVFFMSKLFIYHKERSIKKFLLQRLVFGSDLFNIIKFGNKIRSFQPILPLFVMLTFFFITFIKIDLDVKFLLVLAYVCLIQFIIFLDIRRYLKGFKNTILSLILINFANIAYVTGNLLGILYIKNLINRKFYIKSRHNR
jgi:cellulose synthase/poly-beta-1,6-N-acetylglucosamine synthase-like glycosyltransferase